jgi:putative thiamine transport system ATP-binding protein
MANFIADNVTVSINGRPLFQPLSFEVRAGKVLAIMGPSGSGKSSLLSYMAGTLQAPLVGMGSLKIENQNIENLAIEQRKVGLLYQDDLLFPHITVGENLLYALSRKGSKAQRIQRVKTSLKNVALENYFARLPETLSGGQRARVSLLRTLLSEPKIILLDEPFSKLDKSLREEFKNFVFTTIERQQIPCVLVTHEKDDLPQGSELIDLEGDFTNLT